MGNLILPAAPQDPKQWARGDNTYAQIPRVDTTQDGLCPQLSGTGTKTLYDDGTWKPVGSGGGSGYTWRGAWNTTSSYSVYDTVSRSGSSYVCVVANTNIDPAVDTTHWNLMAQAGSPGSKWYNGSSDPVTVSGSITGDYYLNNTSGAVFQLS
jgi:hypothetical protein